MLKHLTITLLAALSCLAATAQELTWSVDFKSVFDNREGDKDHDQTIFFTRLSPELGISLPGGHRIAGGVAWNQPVGNGWHDYKLCPTLYYKYTGGQWRVTFGMFSREHLMEEAPKVVWSDSLSYNQPNVRGVLVQYVRQRGFVELALDWRQLQSDTRREAFNVNLNSRWQPFASSPFYVGERIQLNHLAKQRHAPEGQSVNDDITLNPFVGVDLSRGTALDSLNLRAGAVVQMERCRIMHAGWQTPVGFLFEGTAQWRWLGLRQTLHIGDNLFPVYGLLGAEFNLGSPYYQSKLYSRTDVYGHIIRNRFVSLEAALCFHATKETFAFWQQLALHVYIDHQLWRGHDSTIRARRLANIY